MMFLGAFDHASTESDLKVLRQLKLCLLYLGKGLLTDSMIFGRFAFSRLLLDNPNSARFLEQSIQNGHIKIIVRNPKKNFIESVEAGLTRGCKPDLLLYESGERFWKIAHKLQQLGCQTISPPSFLERGSKHFVHRCAEYFLDKSSSSCLWQEDISRDPEGILFAKRYIREEIARRSETSNIGRRDFEEVIWKLLKLEGDFAYATLVAESERSEVAGLAKAFYREVVTLHQTMYIEHADAGASFVPDYVTDIAEGAFNSDLDSGSHQRVISPRCCAAADFDSALDSICDRIFEASIDHLSFSDIATSSAWYLRDYLRERQASGQGIDDAVLLRAVEDSQKDLARLIQWRLLEKPGQWMEADILGRKSDIEKRMAEFVHGGLWNSFFTLSVGTIAIATFAIPVRVRWLLSPFKGLHRFAVRRGLVRDARQRNSVRPSYTARNMIGVD